MYAKQETNVVQRPGGGGGGGGVLPKILGGRVPHGSQNPDPISDQNIRFFRPEPENL